MHYLSKIVALLLLLVAILPSDAFIARFGGIHRPVGGKLHTLKMINPVDFKAQLSTDMKEAMKSKQKIRLSGIRAIQASVRQKEIEDQQDIT